MPLRCAKNPSLIHYRPANPSLLGWHQGQERFVIQIPNVIGISSQFTPLIRIWDDCIESLSDYSRAKGKREGSAATLKAHLALPPELRSATAHPLAEQWDSLLGGARQAGGPWFLAASEASQMLEIPERVKLTMSQSRDLAEAIESLGFAVEPDSRYCGASYGWDQELGVFKPKSGKVTAPSSRCLGAQALLELCIFIAGADGNVGIDELTVSRGFIERHAFLSPQDQERISVFEQLLLNEPQRAKSSFSKIARRVPKEQREKIGEILVCVANADNLITKDELKSLERAFKSLELQPGKLEQLLDAIKPEFREVTVQPAGVRVPGEAIPASGFRIDMSRVEAIASETKEVIGILAEVMAEDDEPDSAFIAPAISKSNPVSNTVSVVSVTENFPAWLDKLGSKYHSTLLKLIERDSWSRTEFEALVKGSGLMPLNVHDAINEWSDEQLGDFLLEGEDPVIIRRQLLPEEATEHG
jgi:tellurite resistance protein